MDINNPFRKDDELTKTIRAMMEGPMKAPQRGSTRKISKKEKEADAKKGIHWPEEVKEKKLDPVDQDELKGKHSERDDKDIDNDGDSDSSDKFLHKKRKAISKAMKDDEDE